MNSDIQSEHYNGPASHPQLQPRAMATFSKATCLLHGKSPGHPSYHSPSPHHSIMSHEAEEKGFNGPIEGHGQNRVVENNPPVQSWLDGRF